MCDQQTDNETDWYEGYSNRNKCGHRCVLEMVKSSFIGLFESVVWHIVNLVKEKITCDEVNLLYWCTEMEMSSFW